MQNWFMYRKQNRKSVEQNILQVESKRDKIKNVYKTKNDCTWCIQL